MTVLKLAMAATTTIGIGVSKRGGVPGARSTSQFFKIIFMHFSGENWLNIRLALPTLKLALL